MIAHRAHRSARTRAVPDLAGLCCAILLLLAALSTAVHAHQGADHKAAADAAAPSAAAAVVDIQGRLGAIVITSRLTGETHRHPVLELADGSRYLLKDGSALPAGATVTIRGRADGRALFVQSTRQVAAPPTAQAMRNAAPQRRELTGTLRMFHIDYADRPAEFGYSLITDSGQQNIVELGTLLPQLENGMRATVTGPVDASGYVAVDTIEILGLPTKKAAGANVKAAVAPAAVTTGYIALPIKFPNNAAAPFTYNADLASWPIATITSSVFGASPAQSVAEYYKEVSFGAQLVSGLVAHSGSAWLKADVARPTTCSTSAQQNAVLNTINSQGATQALAAGYDVGSYQGILYVIDALPCGWLGLGYIGWERSYSKGTASLGVVGHEFGHNFGLYHAGRLNCGSSTTPIATSGCTVIEYGDPYDIMGNISTMHLAAAQKSILGYILPSTTPTHSAGVQTYNLGPIELASQSQYAVVIPTGAANRTYWLEFRRPIGFDSALSAGATGAQIRLARPFEWNNCSGCSGNYDDTQLLDMTPGDGTFSNAALPVGQSYNDSTHGITIEVISASTSVLQVKVTAGGSLTPTTTTVASSANPSTQGQSVNLTASVTGSAPTGTVGFSDGGSSLSGCTSVALSGSGNTRTAVCATAALAVGVHSIVANYSGNASNASSSSTALSQSVKASTTTTLASSQNPSTSGSNVTFTATINGSAPTGSVAFTADGGGISGCSSIALTGSGDSRTAACTTSALAVGTRSIIASYGGNSANGTSASAALSQVVNVAPPPPTTSTTALASSANPSTSGSSVTFTATVAGSAPTGSVVFSADGAGIAGCAAVTLSGSGNSRTANCATSALAVGSRSIVASYGGNAGNTASASAPLAQVVNAVAAPTKTTVTSAANTGPAGATVSLTATIAANPAVTGGTVAFTANGTSIAGCTSVPVTTAGSLRQAICNAGLMASGAYSIVASYGGTSASLPSVSQVFSQVVSFAPIGNTLQFATSAYAVNENAGTVAITVTRIGDASAAAQVDYAAVAGTATANVDYTNLSGTLSWLAGDAYPRQIVVPVVNDGLAEADETFTFNLSNAVGATLGANAVTTVTILDDESAPLLMPGTATVVQNPYGTLSVAGATLVGNTISNLQKNAVIQLGNTAGGAGSLARIDFQGFDIGAGNTLTIRSGAPGQSVHVVNTTATASALSGLLQTQGGNGAAAPQMLLRSEAGISVTSAGVVSAPAGLTLDLLGAVWTTGGNMSNQGSVDGGGSLQLYAAKVNGGGAFRGNAMLFATFGNLNNPVNGAHFPANGLQLFPSSGAQLNLTLAGYGSAPQYMNLMLNADATLAMPSAWPGGSTLPPNNRPVMPAETRAAGVPDPAYGGGSIIVQATGTLTLQGGVSGDFIFPGGLVLKSGGALDLNGTALDNGWTTAGTPFQGVYVEAPSITNSAGGARIAVRTNHFNWANFSARPLVPVDTWTLQRLPDGSAQYIAADAAAPHLNFFALPSEAAAAGQCWVCLINTQTMDFSVAP